MEAGKGGGQGCTLPRAGTQGSACTEQHPRPVLPILHQAPALPHLQQEGTWLSQAKARAQWNSPEAGCIGPSSSTTPARPLRRDTDPRTQAPMSPKHWLSCPQTGLSFKWQVCSYKNKQPALWSPSEAILRVRAPLSDYLNWKSEATPALCVLEHIP